MPRLVPKSHLFLACLAALAFAMPLWAQAPVFFTNPSFEANPGYSKLPGGWNGCGYPNRTAPDVHPVKGGVFQVVQQPYEGNTYLGMVVREDATNEEVGQRLTSPLQVGQCYSFSVQLCRSAHLYSVTAASQGHERDFNGPTILRVWGGMSLCGQKHLLASSPPIDHLAWKKYTFQFQAPDSLAFLSLETYFVDGTEKAYNGNLLLDGLSPLVPLDCSSLTPLVSLDTVSIPGFDYVKATQTSANAQSLHQIVGPDYVAFVEMQSVTNPNDLPALIDANCSRVRFMPGSGKLTAFEQIGFLEIGYNMANFPSYRLQVAILDSGKKINKKRLKTIRKAFRLKGLDSSEYDVSFVAGPPPVQSGWQCGEGDVWFLLEKNE